MAIYWTGAPHDTPSFVNLERDYDCIAESSRIARDGVLKADLTLLAEGITLYHATQLDEGMATLPEITGSIARKYCGGGHGGYALYLFPDSITRDSAVASVSELRAVEPFCRI